MREFFGIEDNYRVEWMDISTLLTVANVVLILAGFAWAPVLGIINSGLSCLIGCRRQAHVNSYVMNIALIILNVYFLNL